MSEKKMPTVDMIINHCIYGLSHFCDGTVNLSYKGTATPKGRCPKIGNCPVREALAKMKSKEK